MITSEGIDTLETFRYAYSEEVDFRKLVEKSETWCKEGESHTTQYKLPTSREHGLK